MEKEYIYKDNIFDNNNNNNNDNNNDNNLSIDEIKNRIKSKIKNNIITQESKKNNNIGISKTILKTSEYKDHMDPSNIDSYNNRLNKLIESEKNLLRNKNRKSYEVVNREIPPVDDYERKLQMREITKKLLDERLKYGGCQHCGKNNNSKYVNRRRLRSMYNYEYIKYLNRQRGGKIGYKKNQWIKFKEKFSRENPDIKGPNLMKEASYAYNMMKQNKKK